MSIVDRISPRSKAMKCMKCNSAVTSSLNRDIETTAYTKSMFTSSAEVRKSADERISEGGSPPLCQESWSPERRPPFEVTRRVRKNSDLQMQQVHIYHDMVANPNTQECSRSSQPTPKRLQMPLATTHKQKPTHNHFLPTPHHHIFPPLLTVFHSPTNPL